MRGFFLQFSVFPYSEGKNTTIIFLICPISVNPGIHNSACQLHFEEHLRFLFTLSLIGVLDYVSLNLLSSPAVDGFLKNYYSILSPLLPY